MACSKVRYRDEIAAKLALASTGTKRHSRRVKEEKRHYRFPRCKGWHLTSQAYRPRSA